MIILIIIIIRLHILIPHDDDVQLVIGLLNLIAHILFSVFRSQNV